MKELIATMLIAFLITWLFLAGVKKESIRQCEIAMALQCQNYGSCSSIDCGEKDEGN